MKKTTVAQSQTTAPIVPELFSANDLAARFKLTRKGVAEFPIPKVRIGRRAVRYRAHDVIAFLERRTS